MDFFLATLLQEAAVSFVKCKNKTRKRKGTNSGIQQQLVNVLAELAYHPVIVQ